MFTKAIKAKRRQKSELFGYYLNVSYNIEELKFCYTEELVRMKKGILKVNKFLICRLKQGSTCTQNRLIW